MMPKELAKELRKAAKFRKMSRSDLLIHIARQYLEYPPMPPAEQARKVREYKRAASRKK